MMYIGRYTIYIHVYMHVYVPNKIASSGDRTAQLTLSFYIG